MAEYFWHGCGEEMHVTILWVAVAAAAAAFVLQTG